VLPISYSVRNVVERPARSLMTASVIALVVIACTLFLALISSLKNTLVSTGNPLNVVVLRKGSDNDGSSQVSLEGYQAIRFFDGIARDERDRPLVSPELVVQPFFHTKDGGRENVLVRGVEEAALAVHDDVRITEGRIFQPSSGEAVIGRGLVGRYLGTELGSELRFGRGKWRVVGVFDAGGSSYESEVWVDARELASDAKRPFPYSGVRIRAASAADIDRLRQRIDDDTRYALEASREIDYYAKQSESSNSLYILVIGIAALAGVGAGFGAANTMYAAVQTRTAEIGTLRALGFSRAAIVIAFEIEAVALSFCGFLLGTGLAILLAMTLREILGGVGFGASTFTTNVITLRVGRFDVIASLILALVIGVASGIGPAWRAARMRPIEALRRG